MITSEPRTITVWKTTNGAEYDSEEEAKDAELKDDLRSYFSYLETYPNNMIDPEELVCALINNWPIIAELVYNIKPELRFLGLSSQSQKLDGGFDDMTASETLASFD